MVNIFFLKKKGEEKELIVVAVLDEKVKI